jgi:hypothetical protein
MAVLVRLCLVAGASALRAEDSNVLRTEQTFFRPEILWRTAISPGGAYTSGVMDDAHARLAEYQSVHA